jgi:hypothetical protein
MPACLRAGLLGIFILLAGSRAGAQAPPQKDGELSLELPTPAQLFRLETEAQSLARIGLERGKLVELPPSAQVVPDEVLPYPFPAQTAFFARAEVCYRTLYYVNPHAGPGAFSGGVLPEPFRLYFRTITLPVRMAIVHPHQVECDYR